MKFWIQNKLSQLEKYLSVPKDHKKQIDVWSVTYMSFISAYIYFWVSYKETNQYVTFFVFLVLAYPFFFKNTLLLRLRLVAILILTAPIINALSYTIDSRVIRLMILFSLSVFVFFINGKKVVEIIKLISFVNIIFCLILIATYYFSKFPKNTNKRPPIAEIISEHDKEKDIYVILLDAFPAKEVLKNYFGIQSDLQSFLKSKGFLEHKHITNYRATQQSIPNLFSGTVFKGSTEYSVKDVSIMESLVPGEYISRYSEKYEYNMEVHSLLLEADNNLTKKYFGRGSDFSIYLFPIVNRLLTYLHFKDSNNKEVDEQLDIRINQLKTSLKSDYKILAFFHFLTFHGSHYDIDYRTQMKSELLKADILGIRIVKMILEKKPNAKIIVTSDHGVRFPIIKNEDTRKGILYIKN